MFDSEPNFDLTIVTVCRNVKDSMAKTVASVVEQKKKHSIRIEHLLVDGASTDGTPELLERLKQEGKIEAYISEPDSGIYDAMNKGIDMARGKVLYFLNADDIMDNGTDLADLVIPIVKGECDACCGQWYVSDLPDSIITPAFYLCFHGMPCCHQAFFMSKALYLKLGKYDAETYRCAADADIIWKMYASAARIKEVERTVVHFQAGGFSANADTDFLDELVLLTYRHKEAVVEHMRSNPDYARYAILHMARYLLHFPGYYHAGRKRAPETAARLKELCNLYREVWKGHPLDCLVLAIWAGPCLGGYAAGKTGFLRRLLLWRIPSLFLSEPEGVGYKADCLPLPLYSTLKKACFKLLRIKEHYHRR